MVEINTIKYDPDNDEMRSHQDCTIKLSQQYHRSAIMQQFYRNFHILEVWAIIWPKRQTLLD